MAKKKEELNLQETKVEKKKVTNGSKTKKVEEKNASVSKASKTKKVSTAKKTEKSSAKSKTTTSKKANTKKEDTKTAKTAKITKDTKAAKIDKETKTAKATKATKTDKSTAKPKATSSKTKNSSKNIKETNNKITPKNEKEKIKEETVIEKIKSFIAKIIAMQEEAKNEELSKKGKGKAKKANKSEEPENKEPVYLPEYYDLPYRYNETVVKILAQTPKRIFVYWDIADEDRIRYEKAFGNDFYQKTYPVLLLHNDDKNYTREIPINDFANSWYIDIQDPKTKYTIQLGRKFKEIPKNIDRAKIQEENIILKTDYLPIAQSNKLEVPNDRILFRSLPAKIKFRNVKTYEEKEKYLPDIKIPLGKIYNIKEFYKQNYKEEIKEEILDVNNPTSGGLSSSSFK